LAARGETPADELDVQAAPRQRVDAGPAVRVPAAAFLVADFLAVDFFDAVFSAPVVLAVDFFDAAF
jgi:hypothetical protein